MISHARLQESRSLIEEWCFSIEERLNSCPICLHLSAPLYVVLSDDLSLAMSLTLLSDLVPQCLFPFLILREIHLHLFNDCSLVLGGPFFVITAFDQLVYLSTAYAIYGL